MVIWNFKSGTVGYAGSTNPLNSSVELCSGNWYGYGSLHVPERLSWGTRERLTRSGRMGSNQPICPMRAWNSGATGRINARTWQPMGLGDIDDLRERSVTSLLGFVIRRGKRTPLWR